MFSCKACHSMGTKTIVFGGMAQAGYFCRTGCTVTMRKPKIGGNNDFKHCSIWRQLENSAFELCGICSAHSLAVEWNYLIHTFLELWKTMNSLTLFSRQKCRVIPLKIVGYHRALFVFLQILFVTCPCMTTNTSDTFLDIAKGKSQVLQK